MKLRNWAVGVTAAFRREVTLGRTLASLEAAGWPRPRVFADGEVEVPLGYEATRRVPPVGGWPNVWLAATELVSREPLADAYLLIQDDVIFCAGACRYVSRFDIPDDCGVLSLFCPACHNRGLGWFTIPVGYGMASAQALAFPRERMYQFLAHPWTVNHRRAAPKSEHFRGDGLHHIDGVVGEWCRQTKTCCYCHSPSLSQHIGRDSAMYPGFEGKQQRRFADSFPGEHVNAEEVFVHFHRTFNHWLRHGGAEKYAIPAALWARIRGDLRPGMRTLETGSGLSTRLFVDAQCRHTALEHHPAWGNLLLSIFPECETALHVCPLAGEPPWYAWDPPDGACDLLLIDGPIETRDGVLRVLDRLVHEETIIYVDGAQRAEDRAFCEAICGRLSWNMDISSAGRGGYARISRQTR